MLARTKKYAIKPFKTVYCISEDGAVYQLPHKVVNHLNPYLIHDRVVEEKVISKIKKNLSVEPEEVFADINAQYTKAAALLKALRLREGLTQKEFAEKIQIRQGDLSKMEYGKRPIGKDIAKRIAAEFGINPNLLLQID